MSNLGVAGSGSPLPTTDATALVVDKTLVNLLEDAIPIAEAAIIAAQPWMGTPVLKEVWEEFFKLTVNELADALGKAGGYVAIDIQKYYALNEAAKALVKLNAAKAGGNPDEIQKASDAVDTAVAPVLHYIGDIHS